jgi:hypothetical protein
MIKGLSFCIFDKNKLLVFGDLWISLSIYRILSLHRLSNSFPRLAEKMTTELGWHIQKPDSFVEDFNFQKQGIAAKSLHQSSTAPELEQSLRSWLRNGVSGDGNKRL